MDERDVINQLIDGCVSRFSEFVVLYEPETHPEHPHSAFATHDRFATFNK